MCWFHSKQCCKGYPLFFKVRQNTKVKRADLTNPATNRLKSNQCCKREIEERRNKPLFPVLPVDRNARQRELTSWQQLLRWTLTDLRVCGRAITSAPIYWTMLACVWPQWFPPDKERLSRSPGLMRRHKTMVGWDQRGGGVGVEVSLRLGRSEWVSVFCWSCIENGKTC